MEGYTTADAIACQRTTGNAQRGRAPPPDTPSNSPIRLERDGIIWIGGVRYQPMKPAPPPEPTTASIAEVTVESAMTAADQGEYSDWTFNNGNPSWGSNDDVIDTASFLLAATDTALIARGDRDPPLYLNSGASTHISCVRSDFRELFSIEPRTITGVGDSSVSATGMGTVVISILGSSAQLVLRDVLFAPSAGVRLVSISRLDDSGHRLNFVDGRCVISDRVSGTTIADCPRNSLHLYILPGFIQSSHSLPPPSSASSLSASVPALLAKPDLETWHRRLGHANFRTILDMAHGKHVRDMPANISSPPKACDACIRGKQTHQPVPKTREGKKATRRLERVFVDLTGPQSVTSRSGSLYIMNIIDDYTGYHWTRLLKAKSDAARELYEWLLLAENQSGSKLCYLVTDNGELRSREVDRWCAERGITRHFTAPHTSAQNGCVEHLHRTLMNKARAMRLACNAPLYLWDEFVLTASYLSTLTASKVLEGRTPYELWFGSPPSLSCLREIGSRAFVFIHGANPKIAAKSAEGTLIGYASNSKAYRVWFHDTGRIVDSFHVTLIEHLDDPSAVPLLDAGTDAPPTTGNVVETPPPSDGLATLPTPPGNGTDTLPRRSSRVRVPAPSRDKSNDGLVRGKATTRALEQVHEAASQRKGEKAAAVDSPPEESLLVHAEGDTPKEEPEDLESFDDVVFLVDVEDPDAPEWSDAIQSNERNKWLEGATAEINGLRDMKVFELVLRRDVPPNCSVL